MQVMHFTFVAWAYGFAAFVLIALIAWIALDYRTQRNKLAAHEAKRAKKK